MRLLGAFLIACFLLPSFALARQAPKSADWRDWQFLLGDWTGEASGQPGKGSGGFTFRLELEGKLLVRRSFSDFPAAKDKPAIHHEDLLYVYREPGAREERAIYFDNEGHVIHYAIEISPDGKTWTFISPVESSAPRYRLTYSRVDDNQVGIKFEIAPPGKPDAFATHVASASHRKR